MASVNSKWTNPVGPMVLLENETTTNSTTTNSTLQLRLHMYPENDEKIITTLGPKENEVIEASKFYGKVTKDKVVTLKVFFGGRHVGNLQGRLFKRMAKVTFYRDQPDGPLKIKGVIAKFFDIRRFWIYIIWGSHGRTEHPIKVSPVVTNEVPNSSSNTGISSNTSEASHTSEIVSPEPTNSSNTGISSDTSEAAHTSEIANDSEDDDTISFVSASDVPFGIEIEEL